MTFISWHIDYYDGLFANDLYWQPICVFAFILAGAITKRLALTTPLGRLGLMGTFFAMWCLIAIQVFIVLLAGPIAWLIVGFFLVMTAMMYFTRPRNSRSEVFLDDA